jgi:hypothetical protein
MTALTLYLNQTASVTNSTADQLLENASTGGTLSNKNTNLVSGTTGWVTLYSQGNATGQTGAGSQPALADNGWIDDAVSLVGNHFIAGTWSVALGFETTATGTFVADFHFRFYQRSSGGTRTLIGEAIASGQTIISTSYTVLTPSVSAAASNPFVSGDKVGCDVTINITTNGTTGNLRMQASSSATLGNVNAEIVTPGYIASTQTNKDEVFRGRISALVSKDEVFRGRIQQLVSKDEKFRGNIGFLASKDEKFRAVIAGLGLKDEKFRGRISALVSKDVNFRGKPANTVTKDISIRARVIGPPFASGGFTLFANGTGTVQYDSFRVTEYPDPSLSLAPITPRIGNSSVNWNALTPTNTTLGTDISLDGVNWTDVSSGNGGNLPGIFVQPAPTTDGFGSNSSANYTSTSRSGGATPTATYDTANSRLILTGGTNGMYLYTSISRADIDFFADLDQSDAGGLVWRFVDQNNFYYLTITDTLASGTPNTITLYRVVANTRTQLGSAAISYNVGPTTNAYNIKFTRGTFRRFRVTMLSGVITCYVDGNSLITATDGSPLGAGQVGLFNSGGTIGSRYYQLWMTQVGDIVTGTPPFDIVTGKFVYTRQRLATTDPTVTPQVSDLTTLATTPEIGIGGVISNAAYNAAFIDKNFDALVQSSGDYLWYIDQNKRFNFHANGSVASPWILQSAPAGLVNNVDLEVNNDLELDVSNDLYRNRMIILGAQGVTSTLPITFVGDGSVTTFTLGYPLAAAPTITLNGVAQTIALKGSTGAQWYYSINDAVLQQDASQTVLQATDQLVVLYTGFFPETVTVDDTTEQARLALLSGDTGIVEAVEDHSSDNPPMTTAQAITYAQGLINRYAVQGRTLIFDTSRNGLAVGQTLSVFIQELGIWDGQFLINQVDISLMKAVGDQQVYWYKVTASELPRQASWAKLLASGLGLQ